MYKKLYDFEKKIKTQSKTNWVCIVFKQVAFFLLLHKVLYSKVKKIKIVFLKLKIEKDVGEDTNNGGAFCFCGCGKVWLLNCGMVVSHFSYGRGDVFMVVEGDLSGCRKG